MECFISGEPLAVVVLPNSASISITSRHVVGIVLLVFYSYIRGQRLYNYGLWQRARQPVGPSLGASPAPIIVTHDAYWGIFGWLCCWFLIVLLVPLIIDLLVLNGVLICKNTPHIVAYIEGGLDGIVTIATKLLKAVAA